MAGMGTRMTENGERLYPPHKAIRRHTHYFIDHFAEIVAILGGQPSRQEEWCGSFVTWAGDRAPFTEAT